MGVRTLKIFAVGPHNESRYKLIREYVERVVAEDFEEGELDVRVVTPDVNPKSGRFNDWIFGQIDTCDILLADMTGFNPNVVYEVSFAHSLGVPCAYLRVPDDSSEDQVVDIKHYFKFNLLPLVEEDELRDGRNVGLDNQLRPLLKGGIVSGDSILSDYYSGVSPVDAEFVRGLAEGYWRNFLSRILSSEPPQEFKEHPFYILIPDTFEKPDAAVRRAAISALGEGSSDLNSNSLGRSFSVNHALHQEAPFFFDIPTTLLTLKESSKYQKIRKADYFTKEDRDRLTDRLARRFVTVLWELIQDEDSTVEWPLENFKIIWLSDVAAKWTEETLLNDDPLPRPDGL